MKYTCVETTIDFEVSIGAHVRLWLNHPDGTLDGKPAMPPEAYVDQIREHWLRESGTTRDELIDFAAGLEGVNAVQMFGYTPDFCGYRVGKVAYTVPFEEAHG